LPGSFTTVPDSVLIRSLLSGSVVVSLAKFGGVGLLFIMQVILARLLQDAGDYGLVVWAMSLVQVLAVISALGMQKAVLRFASGYLARRQFPDLALLVGHTRRLVLSAATVVSALLVAWSWYFAGGEEHAMQARVLMIVALCVPFLAFAQVNAGIAQAHRWYALAFMPERLLRPSLVILGCGVAYLSLEGLLRPDHAALIILLSTLTWVLVQAFALGRRRAISRGTETLQQKADPAELLKRAWLQSSAPFFLVSVLQMGMHYGDVLLLGVLSNAEETGEYFAVSRLAQLVSLPLVIVAAVLAPRFAEFDALGERAKLQSIITLGAHFSLWPTLFIAAVMASFPVFFLAIFGEEYQDAQVILFILVAAQVFNVAMGPSGTLMNMTGHQTSSAMLLGAVVVLSLILNVVLIPPLGALGAGIANAIAMLFWNLGAYVYVRRRLRVEPSVMHAFR
jgi:O-antigen/teichoic acid export membrane protein